LTSRRRTCAAGSKRGRVLGMPHDSPRRAPGASAKAAARKGMASALSLPVLRHPKIWDGRPGRAVVSTGHGSLGPGGRIACGAQRQGSGDPAPAYGGAYDQVHRHPAWPFRSLDQRTPARCATQDRVGSSRELARLLHSQKNWDRNPDLTPPVAPAEETRAPIRNGRSGRKGLLAMLTALSLATAGLVALAVHRASGRTPGRPDDGRNQNHASLSAAGRWMSPASPPRNARTR
jgi:hypothetical protein